MHQDIEQCPQEPRIKVLEQRCENLEEKDRELKSAIKELTVVVNELTQTSRETLAVFNFLKWFIMLLITLFGALIVAVLLEMIKVI